MSKHATVAYGEESDARLIAAAPEMAEALRELKTLMIYEQDGWDGIAYTRQQQQDAIEKAIEAAEAALQKAGLL